MLTSKPLSYNFSDWKRINMRNVAHLLGVEFIHDLYNRHEPKINSVRFRHTITTWKNGIVNSYAPNTEWEQLATSVSYQYYNINHNILRHTKLLYKRKREHFHEFINRLKNTDLSSLSNAELSSTLINFQSIVLGELYVLNFVQIEHGLNIAVKKAITDIEPDPAKAESLFVSLIETEIPTASQREKIKLYNLARKYRILNSFHLYNEEVAKEQVTKHCHEYAYLYSAYGENPRNFNDFWQNFQNFFNGIEKKPIYKRWPRLMTKRSKKQLNLLSNIKLNILIPLLIRGGIFRDTNKALLGLSVKYRFLILDEITKRGLETRDNLNYYLLSEITELLNEKIKVLTLEIDQRKKNGVTLIRSEEFKSDASGIFIYDQQKSDHKLLKGSCASQGNCEGICKVVLTKKDAEKVQRGDIMIAIGTDFDLIEAMYRAAAVITEEGGILSHASVVCREINKPCIIAVKNATTILQDGLKVKIHATRGEIFLD